MRMQFDSLSRSNCMCKNAQRPHCPVLEKTYLPRIWEMWDDCRDAPCGRGPASTDHDEELHNHVINLPAPTLDDEHVFLPDALVYGNPAGRKIANARCKTSIPGCPSQHRTAVRLNTKDPLSCAGYCSMTHFVSLFANLPTSHCTRCVPSL
jgi:hypothetical protein